MSTVKKWKCTTCNVPARKRGTRWMILHRGSCTAFEGTEDVGPVTSVNDPDNALYLPSD